MFVIITRSIVTGYVVAAICAATNNTGAESDHGYESNQDQFDERVSNTGAKLFFCFHGCFIFILEAIYRGRFNQISFVRIKRLLMGIASIICYHIGR
jgi:hypothetical protein